HQRQFERTDLQPENRGRASGHRRILPHCGTDRRHSVPRADASLARRGRRANYTTQLIGFGRTRMAKVVVVTSGKGGVGKTTSTAALGAALAQMGEKLVVVD